MQRHLPKILSVLFVLAILGTAGYRTTSQNMTQAFGLSASAAIYLLWIALEFKIARKETEMASTARDKGTLELYAAARALTALAFFVFVEFRSPFIFKILGAVVFGFGVLFRLWAITTLGKMYSHRVRLQEQHSLVSGGPYRWLRHPAYTGMLFAHLGLALICESPVPLAIWALFFVPMVVLRILVEERSLFELPGYDAFARARKRLVPFVW